MIKDVDGLNAVDKVRQAALNFLQTHTGNEGKNMYNEELSFFIENQDALVVKYPGKVLAIKGKEIIGVFDSALDAYLETQKTYTPGSFMIQPCEPGPSAYTAIINSNMLATV